MVDIDLDLIKKHISLVVNSTVEINKLGFSIECSFDKNIEINASVKRTGSKDYLITFSDGCFSAIACLVNYCFDTFVDSDFDHYKFFQYDTFFRLIESDSDKHEFMNHIAMQIVDTLICHELGHIVLGHCIKCEEKFEEISNKCVTDARKKQIKELCADWFSCFKTLSINLYSNESFRSATDFDDLDFYWTIRREVVTLFVANTILFMHFARNNDEYNKINFTTYDHPHPHLRTLYLFDALLESCIDAVQSKTHWSYEESKQFSENVFQDSYEDIRKFLLPILGADYSSLVTSIVLRNEYFTLRSKRYLDKHNQTPLIKFYVDYYTKEDWF